MSDDELTKVFTGYGWKPYFLESHEPEHMHQLMATSLDHIVEEIHSIQQAARGLLNRVNLFHNMVKGRRHELVHVLRFVAFEEVGLPAISGEHLRKLVVGHAPEHRGIGNFVSVQVQNG